MSRTSKIDPKYIGTTFRIPTITTCVIWLMLDRLQVSPVLCGIIWTIWVLLSLCVMAAPFTENWMHPRHLPNEDGASGRRH